MRVPFPCRRIGNERRAKQPAPRGKIRGGDIGVERRRGGGSAEIKSHDDPATRFAVHRDQHQPAENERREAHHGATSPNRGCLTAELAVGQLLCLIWAVWHALSSSPS